MSFLQPALLLALPLMVLPVVIHLINQRRYQSMPWGAMQFLLTATRMSRGLVRIRQWLILLLRMLVIGALLLAVSRPLTSGRFSLAGRPDTTMILLDRSPSMMQQVDGVPKWLAATRELANSLPIVGSQRWILIDSTSREPRAMTSPTALRELLETEPTSAASDIPALLQVAHDYIGANQTGRTEIWIASDLRTNDWQIESGQWRELRNGFSKFAQSVRFHLLAYPQTSPENLAVRVAKLQRISTGAELRLSLTLDFSREGIVASPFANSNGVTSAKDEQRIDHPVSLPVQLEIDGARSELTVEMVGSHDSLKDFGIALSRQQRSGWGRVSIPADANRADNDFYFVFDMPPPRRTLVVSEDRPTANLLQLAASIGPDLSIACHAEVVPTGQLATTSQKDVALLLWHGPLPVEAAATWVQSFVEQGGQVIFLPPAEPAAGEWLGVRWGNWVDARRAVISWRGDEGLLANTESGAALPVDKLTVHRYCTLSGDLTPLATLDEGDPLLARVTTDQGGVFFLATTPANSSLASQGVMWYVAIQRALAVGATRLANAHNRVAGQTSPRSSPVAPVPGNAAEDLGAATVNTSRQYQWHPLAGNHEALSTDYADHRGVYRVDGRLIAVNRPIAEDHAPVLTDKQVDRLFAGLDFVRMNRSPGSDRGLIEEIWRTFLAMMMVAMLLEAALCMPKRPTRVPSMAPRPLPPAHSHQPPQGAAS